MPKQVDPEARRQLDAIDPSKLYPIEVLKRVSGLGTASFRAMRRAGLPVRYCHGRSFCLGRDFIQAISEGKGHKDE